MTRDAATLEALIDSYREAVTQAQTHQRKWEAIVPKAQVFEVYCETCHQTIPGRWRRWKSTGVPHSQAVLAETSWERGLRRSREGEQADRKAFARKRGV